MKQEKSINKFGLELPPGFTFDEDKVSDFFSRRDDGRLKYVDYGFIVGIDKMFDIMKFLSNMETDIVRMKLLNDSVLLQCMSLDRIKYAEIEINKEDMGMYKHGDEKSIYFQMGGTHFNMMHHVWSGIPRRYTGNEIAIAVLITDNRIEFVLPGGVIFYANLLTDEDFSNRDLIYHIAKDAGAEEHTIETENKTYDKLYNNIKTTRSEINAASATMSTLEFEKTLLGSRSTFDCLHWELLLDKEEFLMKTDGVGSKQEIKLLTKKIDCITPVNVLLDKEYLIPFKFANLKNMMTVEIRRDKPIVLEQVNKLGSRIMLTVAPRIHDEEYKKILKLDDEARKKANERIMEEEGLLELV